MGVPVWKVLAETAPLPKVGASSVGARATTPVLTFPLPEWAAAATCTASVAGTSKSKPLAVASVNVAVVLPDVPPVMPDTERPESVGFVASEKLDADTPEA